MTPNREVSMSTSLLYHGFSIRGYKYVRTEYQNGEVVFTIRQNLQSRRCEACGSHDVRSRGHVERRFRSLPVGSRATSVVLPIPRVECQACGVMRQAEVSFADPRRCYTKGLRAVRLGAVPAHDHPRRGPPPERQLGRHQGHPEARPDPSLCQA
jgi:zinc-finger of transposase IS204/IS1001/IS1096/IS1165